MSGVLGLAPAGVCFAYKKRGRVWLAGLFGGKDGLLGDFLFLFGEVYGYVDVVLGFWFFAGLFFAGPEEGPADCPEDEDDGEEEKDERTFAHVCPP